MTTMERRWWLLGVLLVIAIAAGFGIGSAVKSTSAPGQAGSLASNASGTGAQATVARPQSGGPVPPLKAKAKAKASHTQTSTSSGAGVTSTASSAVTTATVTQTATTPPPSLSTTAAHTTLQSST